MEGKVNLGGANLRMFVSGVDESLEKLNLLTQKIAEVNSLILELNSAQVKINFTSNDVLNLQVDG